VTCETPFVPTNSSNIGEVDSGGESPYEEDMVLFVKRFNRYIKKHGLRRSDKNSSSSRKLQTKGEISKDENDLSCVGCGKVGHLRSQCPDLIKPKGKASSSDKSRGRRAYIAWEDDEVSSTKSDSENDEISQLCFMGQRKKSIEVSNPRSKINPSYDELQNVLVEMHGDAMNAFKTIGTQKTTVLKLEAEIAKIKKDFENFKNEHASLKKEQFVTPPKESPTIDVPMPSKDKDINICGACPKLQSEIVTLKSKIEQVSSASINFANQFTKTSSFKNAPKRNFKKKNRKSKIHEHKLRCNYCREIGHTTPHCHVMKILVPKGIMMWVPKLFTFVTNPKDPTCVGDLNFI